MDLDKTTHEPLRDGLEEIELKESAVIDEVFADGKLLDERIETFFELDIEGKKHRWHEETIAVEEIARLGGWGVHEGALHIDADNNERTLCAGEIVRLEVGVRFAKKVRFRRG
jgi:hypothetical protein